MQDIVCAVIYRMAPANFWVPPPQKFHYLELWKERTQYSPPFLCRGGVSPPAKRTNNTATTYVTPYYVILSTPFVVGRGFISRRKTHKLHGYNLCHTIFCHPEFEPFKGRTEKQPKDLCRLAATTNLDGKIKNVPSKKYRECDSVADSSHSFSVLPLTSLLLRMTF